MHVPLTAIVNQVCADPEENSNQPNVSGVAVPNLALMLDGRTTANMHLRQLEANIILNACGGAAKTMEKMPGGVRIAGTRMHLRVVEPILHAYGDVANRMELTPDGPTIADMQVTKKVKRSKGRQ